MRIFNRKKQKRIIVCPVCGISDLIGSDIIALNCKDCKIRLYLSEITGRFEMDTEKTMDPFIHGIS